MIRRFKHKGLKKFFETGSTAGIDAKQAKKNRAAAERAGFSESD